MTSRNYFVETAATVDEGKLFLIFVHKFGQVAFRCCTETEFVIVKSTGFRWIIDTVIRKQGMIFFIKVTDMRLIWDRAVIYCMLAFQEPFQTISVDIFIDFICQRHRDFICQKYFIMVIYESTTATDEAVEAQTGNIVMDL